MSNIMKSMESNQMNIINKIKAFFSGSTKPLNLQDYTYKYAGYTIDPKYNICAKFYFDAYSKNGKYAQSEKI